MGDLRRHSRTDFSGKAMISWQDGRGEQKSAQVQIVDVSQSGAQLLAPEEIPLRSQIGFRGLNFKVNVAANVRYCRREKLKFRVGLEFPIPVKW